MEPATPSAAIQYVGFWARVGASIIDTILIMVVIAPIALAVVGREYFDLTRTTGGTEILLEWIFPAVAVIVFWIYRSATPGKIVINAVIVDASTFGKPSTGQFIGRYLGYFVSTIPLGLGLFWIGWDKRKQGWHDKLAGTVVIRAPRSVDQGRNS
ncbi:MAG: RDD family protein [Nevskiales bacterium]